MTRGAVMCLDKRVLIGLAAVGVAVWAWGPQWSVAALPLLVVLVCPLSMFLMMRTGRGARCGMPMASGQEQDSESTEHEDELVRLREEINVLKAHQAKQGQGTDT